MPHKIVQIQPSGRSIGTQIVAKCFCKNRLQETSCFSNLPIYIQTLINEHYASAEIAHKECTSAAPQTGFTRFLELPATVQENVVRFCMPSGQVRYLESRESVDEDSTSALLQSLPPAAQANRLFYSYFKERWKMTTINEENCIDAKVAPGSGFINFAHDQLVIDINRPLSSLRNASYLVQYSSSQRQGHLPVRLSETWAHTKAETDISSLPAAFFEQISHLHTYWLIISDLAIGTAVKNSAETECRCVFSPMIKCLSDRISTKCHAFRYHVKTGKVTCAEMNRNQELDGLLAACGEKNPNFAARVTFIYGDEARLLDTRDGLDWWHLPAWGLLNFKYEKLKKRLDWGLVTGVLQHQLSDWDNAASGSQST